MEVPNFSKENINPKLCQQDVGDSFQDFIYDLLHPEYTDLHLFPSRGKDGAIDLSQTEDTSRVVFECKYISEDRHDNDCSGEWKEVAKKLDKHLADASGPTKGQAQYKPWYRTNQPISEYIFCVSSIRSNQNKIDTLEDEIKEFFSSLSSKYEHLTHLNELSVKVIDWSDCRSRLKQRPHLIYRWFPKTRPQGLVPLDDSPDRGTFRSYLTSEKLPYFSLGQHLKDIPAPQGIDIPDEDNLLNQLEGGDTTGLIVTGSGGVGKTRLMLEIGRAAKQKGWMVLRVQSRLKDDAIEQLAERLTPEIPVLLLIDYIETQKRFTELVDTLNELNDTLSLQLRYVASCRTSFYPTISAISRQKQVDLSPINQYSVMSWYGDYQRHIVRHILENSGVDITDRHLEICNNKPILAVFISYLQSTGRQTQLPELLKEEDFGTWIAKRVQLSFGKTVINRDLAMLMALFPMQYEISSHLDQGNQKALFDTLATDGWIE
ncbi:MAG: ATP-binding protein, partial [Candidatus Heimdallarchaeota archaeon]|nr:ATP-binding protein [Candidatus Heimdallarchaeota archaeon]